MLSKSDKRELNTIQAFLTSGNIGAVVRLAQSFIRSSTSDQVENKRRVALEGIGVAIGSNLTR